MKHPIFVCLFVFSTFASSMYQKAHGADQLFERPTDPKKALGWEVDRHDTRLKKPMKQTEKLDWFRRNGQVLSDAEIKALRSLIDSAECSYSGYGREDKNVLPERRRVPRPHCGQSSDEPLTQCNARIKCVIPKFTFFVGAICFSMSTASCPDAKSCAMQTDFSLKRNDLWEDSQTPLIGNMWVWGYAHEN